MKSAEITLKADSYFGGTCEVKFDENGWELINDTRNGKDGYLHVADNAPEEITEKLCKNLIKYIYQHEAGIFPGLGATPQSKYLSGYSVEEKEKIGNNGKRAFYNR